MIKGISRVRMLLVIQVNENSEIFLIEDSIIQKQ